MTFFRCGGSEEKKLGFKLSSANGTQGVFHSGRYWGGMKDKNQGYVPLGINSYSVPTYTTGATRVIHVRFCIDWVTNDAKDICGVRYGGSYWPCMPYLYLYGQSNEYFIAANFSSNGTSVAKAIRTTKANIPYVQGRWYDIEYGWDKNTKEIYLEVTDDAGNHQKVTDTLDTLFQYSTDYEFAVGMMNQNSGTYANNVTFDLWNTWYEENHSRLVWGVKGG